VLGALKNIVIRNSRCCKEMTIMTMFLGVSSSDVCDWDTKLSATDPRVKELLAADRRCRRGVQAARVHSRHRFKGSVGGFAPTGARLRAAKMWLGGRNKTGF
jgi:hypothetical protein